MNILIWTVCTLPMICYCSSSIEIFLFFFLTETQNCKQVLVTIIQAMVDVNDPVVRKLDWGNSLRYIQSSRVTRSGDADSPKQNPPYPPPPRLDTLYRWLRCQMKHIVPWGLHPGPAAPFAEAWLLLLWSWPWQNSLLFYASIAGLSLPRTFILPSDSFP